MSSFYGNSGIINNNGSSSNLDIPTMLTTHVISADEELGDGSWKLDQTANTLYQSFCNGLLYVLYAYEENNELVIKQELITHIDANFDNQNNLTYFQISYNNIVFSAMNGDDYPSYISDSAS